MKLTKLILLSILGLLMYCPFVSALGENVTVLGDTRADTLSLEVAALPASGSGTEIRYNNADGLLYIWNGTEWEALAANKNVATKIVAVDRNSDRIRDDGDSDLTDRTADYICDGTDDQVEIQQAIDALVDDSGNGIPGVVYLLQGTYEITDSIVLDNGIVAPADGIDDSGKAIIGAGSGTVLSQPSGTSNLAGFYVTVDNVLITRLKLEGYTDAGNLSFGIHLYGASNCKINNVWTQSLVQGIRIESGSRYNVVSDCHITSPAIGIFVYQASSTGNIIVGNNISGCRTDGIAIRANYNTVSGNNSFSSNTYGISLAYADYNVVSGNVVSLGNDDGISLLGSDNNIITGNSIGGNNISGTGLAYGAITVSYDSNYNTVSGNCIYSETRNGIHLYRGATFNNITGNFIYDMGNTYSGILIDGSSGQDERCDNNIISSNHISPAPDDPGTGYGISIADAYCDSNYLAANYIDDSGSGFSGAISDSGTNTQYTSSERITLERRPSILTLSAAGQIDPATNPRTYIYVESSGGDVTLTTDPPILAGKAAGDILILEGTSDVNTVTIPRNTTTTRFAGTVDPMLGANDTLSLIWSFSDDDDDTNDYWLELSYTDN